MSRINIQHLAKAITKVQAMNSKDKENLVDELFLKQPNILGSVVALKNVGVSIKKIDFVLIIVLTCYQAMKESGIIWPVITIDDIDTQLNRYTGIVTFSDGLGENLKQKSVNQYIDNYPEAPLLAFVTDELNNWLKDNLAEESDKYLIFCATNMVNCISYIPLNTSLN
jgi:hypothetical protein